MLKSLLFLFILSVSGIAFSQNKIDPRLLENEGKKIEEIYQFRPDYYHYLVFELDKGYELLNKKEAKSLTNYNTIPLEQLKNSKGEVLSLEAINAPSFNFKSFGLAVHLKEQSLVKIDKHNYLKINTKLAIAKEFSKSPLSHK